uniref:Coatomer subunit delta n=1 Tax=Eucampia antarctica TaxID=49252 RepID=A0A7S2WDM3_9STRA|mmetsp:Transcript_27418/g.26279  ORF Transcript_27418/g.26279 Transcript_27418/m.26279 type:complete len:109 (+) Transcript_27418:176-502(+)
MTLTDVNILVPLGSTDPPSIMSIDGQYKCDNGMMCWHHDIIDNGNATGSIEFSIPGQDVAAFFPVQITFQSQNLLCPIDITGVTSSTNGASIPNTMTKNVVPESYVVQ